MGYTVVTFAVPVECNRFDGIELTLDSVADALSPNDWQCGCRNGWYQSTLAAVLDAYQDFEELRYLCGEFALVRAEELPAKSRAVHGLIAAIRRNAEPFVEATKWYGASDADVLKYVDEAQVLRDVSDACIFAFDNFFSFLISHAAAIEEAEKDSKCLLHATYWG